MPETREGIELSRDTYNGGDIRLYEDGDTYYPSVTTIKNHREDPDKEAAIEGWKANNDGTDGPHWTTIRSYKGWRGTLAHYACLNNLTDRELYGEEEATARTAIEEHGQYRGDDMEWRCLREANYVVNQFEQIAQDRGIIDTDDNDDTTLVDGDGYSTSNVRDVERYVLDRCHEYAGQFDLLYQSASGETVMADLKTSKLRSRQWGLRTKFPGYGLQMAAYAHAINVPVDRLEVIWIDPGNETVEVIPERDWPRTRQSYFEEFANLAQSVQSTLDEYGDTPVSTSTST